MTANAPAPTPAKWHHGRAAITTFLATPVIGLSQIFVAEAVAASRSFWAEVYQATAWMMVLSVVISWLILPLLLPLTTMAAHRFGASFWLAIPFGALIGWIVICVIGTQIAFGSVAIAAALTGAIMAAIYCGALRWFAQD